MLAAELSPGFTKIAEPNNYAENRLLAALPRREFRRLLPDFELVALPIGEILYRCGEVIRYVYFPVDSVVSLLSEVEEDVRPWKSASSETKEWRASRFSSASGNRAIE